MVEVVVVHPTVLRLHCLVREAPQPVRGRPAIVGAPDRPIVVARGERVRVRHRLQRRGGGTGQVAALGDPSRQIGIGVSPASQSGAVEILGKRRLAGEIEDRLAQRRGIAAVRPREIAGLVVLVVRGAGAIVGSIGRDSPTQRVSIVVLHAHGGARGRAVNRRARGVVRLREQRARRIQRSERTQPGRQMSH